MKPSILIIGASPAGLQAALDLAKAGIEVLLAEISPFIGENPPFKYPECILIHWLWKLSNNPVFIS